MLLALDIGNSNLFGGVYDGSELALTFRKSTTSASTSDEFGLFFRAVLRESGIDPSGITEIAFCSVVPDLVHSLRNGIVKYFGRAPFALEAGVRTGLQIRYRNPLEVGADRIANAIAAVHRYPGENLILIDFGTATTVCAISKEREYLGGVILPGVRISMQALEENTAKLPAVEIRVPASVLGRSTVESIQSGLYYGTVGMIREITRELRKNPFNEEPVRVIGTGGFARMFAGENLLDHEIPDLVLDGVRIAYELNRANRGASIGERSVIV